MGHMNPLLVAAYATAEVTPGGDWGNVVVLQKGVSADEFSRHQVHHSKISGGPIAPSYYSRLRIHRCSYSLVSGCVRFNRTLSTRFESALCQQNTTTSTEGGILLSRRCVLVWNEDETYGRDSLEHYVGGGISREYIKSCDAFIESLTDAEPEHAASLQPMGYDVLDEEEAFDWRLHLQLSNLSTSSTLPTTPTVDPLREEEEEVELTLTSLLSLGYNAEHVDKLSTSFGQSSSFRVLSEEGILTLRTALARLDRHAQSSPRIAKVLRGSSFRSKFIRDLCLCPQLTQYVSDLANCCLVPHPMLITNAHTNLLAEGGRRVELVDKWYEIIEIRIYLTNLSLKP